MTETIYALKENGDNRVKITDNGYGLEFYVMRNGRSWSGFGVDFELLVLMGDVINEYFGRTDEA